jgi:formate--tetrahydrofolate ligase
MRPIDEIAYELGIPSDNLSHYGKFIAKVSLDSLNLASRGSSSRSGSDSGGGKGKLVLVSAMTPTPHGEGKTVTAIGLGMGLRKLRRTSVVCVRQPSMGPVFGIKGGGAGGGKATIEPLRDLNMRFTGDIDAIGAAHNLLSAVIDNHIFHGNELAIQPSEVTWRRAIDMEDRALRNIRVALSEERGGGSTSSVPRDDGFIVTAASEVMAILCLSDGYADLKRALGRITVGRESKGRLVRAEQLKVVGAMAALLKDAMLPNLVQTSEGTPALVHGGPFGNIAHGTSSLLSIRLGLSLAEYCVVEAGFATDLGAEKFFDIVARRGGGLNIDAIVIVASVRALRHHGGGTTDTATLLQEDIDAVERGLENLAKHIENVRLFGLDPVVAMNRFPADSDEEIERVAAFCQALGVKFAVSSAFSEGGEGAVDLAGLVIEASERGAKSHPLYSLNDSFETKLDKIVRQVYGGESVTYEARAVDDIRRLREEGAEDEPICVAKTALSLSADPRLIGRPSGFAPAVREVGVSAGASFNVVYMGDVVTMPGLPSAPAAERISLSDQGEISGVL